MRLDAPVRHAIAVVLDAYGKTLRATASCTADAAERLAPPDSRDRTGAGRRGKKPARTEKPPAAEGAGATAVAAAPATEAPATEQPRPEPTDVAALAKRPAPQVIAALEQLSADELAELYELERTGRHRRRVLEAIDAAARPRGQEAEAAAAVVAQADADVRAPDAVVYSTETPNA